MSCTRPLYALDLGVDPESGKKHIKLLPRRTDLNLAHLRYKYGQDSVLCLPCGHCVQCKLDYSKEWAVRCELEARLYPDSTYFITLTYDDDHVPLRPSKKDFQDFIQNIRREGHKVRYFGCGEFGEDFHRSHLHIMLFGLKLDDLVLYQKTSTGYLYNSKTIDRFWKNKGFCTVADGSFNTAGYIARYCMKKIQHEEDKFFEGEFILMSKRPGIGERYLKDHMSDILKYDRIVGSFGHSWSAHPPRYFEKIAEKYNIDLSNLKQKRLSLSKDICRSNLIRYVFPHEEMLWTLNRQIGSMTLNKGRRAL